MENDGEQSPPTEEDSMHHDKVVVLRKVLQAAVQGVEKEYGVKVVFGSATYSASDCTFKVSVMDIGYDGKTITRESVALRERGELYGLPKDALGRVIRLSHGKEFRITGLNPKATRFIVVAEEVSSGKEYKLPLESVQRALGVPVLSAVVGKSVV